MKCLALVLAFFAICMTSSAQSLEEAVMHAQLLSDQGSYDEAIILLKEALDSPALPSSDTLLTEAYHQLGVNYFRSGNDEQAIYYWYQEIERLKENKLQIARALRNIGKSYSFLGELQQAEESLRESLHMQLASENQEIALLGNTYRDLGFVFIEQEDMLLAEEHLQQAASIYEQLPQQHHRQLGALYSDLFWLSQQKNQPDSALYYAQQALQSCLALTDKKPEDTFDIANRYHNLGLAYQSLDSLPKAKYYYHRSLDINLKYQQNRWEALANNYNDLSVVYLQLKAYAQAEQYIYKAIAINEELADTRLLADNYNNLAEIKLGTHRLDEALVFINKSIHYLVPGFQNQDPLVNPPMHDSSIVVGDRLELAKSLADKARIISNLAKYTDPTYLSAAVETYRTATDLLNEIRADFGSSQSKHYFAANARSILEQAMQANLNGYQQLHQDKKYLSNILSLMEQSRAVSLLDELNEERAKVMAGIPAMLLDREETIQQEIADLETRIYEGEDSLLTTLIDKRRALEQLKKDTLTRYPVYANLKTPELVSLTTLQQELINPDQALWQYFVGDSSLFCLYIDQTDAQVYSIPLPDNLTVLVAQLDSLLTDESSGIASFRAVAHQLYLILLEQPLARIKGKRDIHRLLIIPDGVLSKIPFDILPYEPANKETRFFSYPYLLHKYAIGYAYSASVFQLQKSYQHAVQKNVGVFSVHDYQNYDHLDNLSGEDAEIAHDMLSGNLYENTTLSSFLQQAPHYQILHLSLHGFGNDQDALQSYLVFKDSILRAADIYAMKLQTAMAVLSGCETGKGQLQEGEGMMSLAHAFAYAGASSTIMSLWKLKDYPSNELFRTFYEKITDENMAKDLALQQAKLALVKTHPQFHHPFYWSALLSSGDQSPIPIGKEWTASFFLFTSTFLAGKFWKLGALALVVLVACTIAMLKMRKSKVA